ncbi:hypothetical protein [Streptomyces sp. KL110A]|uniref:hypothetical protein n=1 Tax=Streptomyces sp. KL110A TaxID=3384221 RepID=UPI0038C4C3EC
MTSLTDAVNALPYRTGDTALKKAVLALVRDTVAVPGTYVVADGVVHQAANRYTKERLRPGGRLWKWTLEAEDPRPVFFEEGKRYRREYGPGKRQLFSVELVRVEDGARFALGRCETDNYGADWVVRRQYHWDDCGWEEVR